MQCLAVLRDTCGGEWRVVSRKQAVSAERCTVPPLESARVLANRIGIQRNVDFHLVSYDCCDEVGMEVDANCDVAGVAAVEGNSVMLKLTLHEAFLCEKRFELVLQQLVAEGWRIRQ